MKKTAPFCRFVRLARSPFPIFAVLSISLVGCPSGSISSPQTADFGEADEISIQPIQVCDDSGNRCARVNLFEDITRKILAQAQLKVSFLPANQLRASRFLSIQDNEDRGSNSYEFYELSRSGNPGAFGRNPDSTRTTGPINVWFVEEIEAAGSGFTQFGLGWVDANGVLISEEADSFNGTGRPDTLAHEIGHNLGLRHGSLGAGGANNLLTDGSRRNIPTSIDDITPDGAELSILTDAQIAEIKRSGFLTANKDGSPGTEVSSADFLDNHDHLDHHADYLDNHADHLDNHLDNDPAHQRIAQTVQLLAGGQLAPASVLAHSAQSDTAANIPEPAGWAMFLLLGAWLATSKKSACEARL